MKFEEKYNEEMANILPADTLNQRILNQDNLKQSTQKHQLRFNWKVSFGIVAAVAMIVLVFNYNSVATFAESIFGRFILSIGDEKVEFGDIQPVDFNFEKFNNDEETQLVTGSESSYHQIFENYEECKMETDLDIVTSDKIQYNHIDVVVSEKSSNIHISSSFDYKDETYVLNGMATAKNMGNGTWGYGTDDEVLDVYEYAEGKKAYFVNQRDKTEKDVCIGVYFVQDNIMYQMYLEVSDKDKGVEIGKELIDILAE